MKIKITILQKLILFSGVILAGISFVGYAVYTSNQKQLESEKLVHHTEHVLCQSGNILSLCTNVETASRGFVITNDREYLVALDTAMHTAATYLNELRKLTANNATQQASVDSLDHYIYKRLTVAFKTVDIRAYMGLDSAIAFVSDKEGKLYSDRIREFTKAIEDEELILLKHHQLLNAERMRVFNVFLVVMYVLISLFTILLLVVTGGYVMQNKDKEERAAELVIANKELIFQNTEKEKRAHELILANKSLIFENQQKKFRADELLIANIQKAEAEKYMHIIEEKNRSITDSINYARYIQEAKLPHKEEIYSALSNSFVLFKPKDIVSGDFYFFYKTDTSLFIAAADCTGHGVPGAILSMMASEKLNEAVCFSTDLSEILMRLNQGFKASLRHTESNNGSTDGMDIAICSVNLITNEVKFAGANRPLWLVRKDENDIEELRGTNRGIGGFTTDGQFFNSHTLQLKPGDTFYIFSDGYTSTFGGPHNKKMKSKRFKQLLIDIQHVSMQEQEHHLNDFVNSWKGNTEQTDDILVIGVRL